MANIFQRIGSAVRSFGQGVASRFRQPAIPGAQLPRPQVPKQVSLGAVNIQGGVGAITPRVQPTQAQNLGASLAQKTQQIGSRTIGQITPTTPTPTTARPTVAPITPTTARRAAPSSVLPAESLGAAELNVAPTTAPTTIESPITEANLAVSNLLPEETPFDISKVTPDFIASSLEKTQKRKDILKTITESGVTDPNELVSIANEAAKQSGQTGDFTFEEAQSYLTGQQQGLEETALADIEAQQKLKITREGELSSKFQIPQQEEELKKTMLEIAQTKSALLEGLGKIEGQQIPMEFITGQQSELQRQASFKIQGLAAVAEALKGNIDLANASVDKALKLEFGDLEDQYKRTQDFYENNIQTLSKKEKATIQKSLDAQKEEIATAKEFSGFKKEVAQAAIKAGPKYASVLKEILAAKDYNALTAAYGKLPEAQEKVTTQIVNIGGRSKLINKATGEVMKDLGVAGKPTVTPEVVPSFEKFFKQKTGKDFNQGIPFSPTFIGKIKSEYNSQYPQSTKKTGTTSKTTSSSGRAF